LTKQNKSNEIADSREEFMKVRRVSDEEALGKCAWCDKKIAEDSEVFGFGATIQPDADLSKYEGEAIALPIVTGDRSVPMLVTSEDSEAKRDGNDLMFMVCSEKCGQDMKIALEVEKSQGDIFAEIKKL
jgi:hypothetical protein